jgi:hypothetical protein
MKALTSDPQLVEHIFSAFTAHQVFPGIGISKCFYGGLVRNPYLEGQTFKKFDLMIKQVYGFGCGQSQFLKNPFHFFSES